MKGQLCIKTATFLFSILLLIGLFGCNTNGEMTTLSEEDTVETEILETDEPTDEDHTIDETTDFESVEDTDNQENMSDKDSLTTESETEASTKTETGKESSSKSDSNGNNSTATANTAEDKKTSQKNKEKPSAPKKEESKTAEPSPPKEPEKQPAPALTATLTIIGPKDNRILETTVNFSEGETVLDVLLKGASKANISVDYSGRGATAYVYGIKDIFEFDHGPRSGWVGRINGSDLTRSSGATEVNNGDTITWVYLEDFMAGQ